MVGNKRPSDINSSVAKRQKVDFDHGKSMGLSQAPGTIRIFDLSKHEAARAQQEQLSQRHDYQMQQQRKSIASLGEEHVRLSTDESELRKQREQGDQQRAGLDVQSELLDARRAELARRHADIDAQIVALNEEKSPEASLFYQGARVYGEIQQKELTALSLKERYKQDPLVNPVASNTVYEQQPTDLKATLTAALDEYEQKYGPREEAITAQRERFASDHKALVSDENVYNASIDKYDQSQNAYTDAYKQFLRKQEEHQKSVRNYREAFLLRDRRGIL